MLSLKQLDTRLQLNLGEQEEQCLVFPVSPEVELTVPVRLLLETCVAAVVCLLPLKPGEDGIVELTKDKEDMPHALPLLPLLSPHWFKPEVTRLTESLKFPWLSQTKPSTISPRPRRLLLYSKRLVLSTMLKRSRLPTNFAVERVR